MLISLLNLSCNFDMSYQKGSYINHVGGGKSDHGGGGQKFDHVVYEWPQNLKRAYKNNASVLHIWAGYVTRMSYVKKNKLNYVPNVRK